MPLAIRYVRSLADVIQPAVEFLSRPVDLFERQRVVVPTAGAKAWLAANPTVLEGWLDGVTTKDGGDGKAAVLAALK